MSDSKGRYLTDKSLITPALHQEDSANLAVFSQNENLTLICIPNVPTHGFIICCIKPPGDFKDL